MIYYNDPILNTKPIKVSLEYLVEHNRFARLPDLYLIKEWFIKNDLEEEGLNLIVDLAKSKANKLEASLNSIRNWDLNMVTSEQFEKLGYDKDTSKNLELIERLGLLNNDLKQYTSLYEWAKETIPTLNRPSAIYVPTLRYLKKYNIYFKNMTEEKINELPVDYEDSWARED